MSGIWTVATPVAAASNNAPGSERVPLVRDFTSRHVIFPEWVPANRVEAIRADPRAWQQYLRRHAHRSVPFDRGRGPDPNDTGSITHDWSFSLNGGNGGTISMPAKYVFDVNLIPNCTTDLVVTGVNVAGWRRRRISSPSTTSINTPTGNGLCPGTAPLVMFAYNVGPGTISSYVALSLDGTKIAFSENNGASSFFHILKWATGAGNGTSASAAVSPGVGNAASDTKLSIAGGSSTAPVIDYTNDVAYVTTSNNVVHEFAGVFRGTPQEVSAAGTGWPVTPGVTGFWTPIFDSVSRHVFFEDSSSGGINYIDDSVVPAVAVTNKFHFAPGITISAPVVVDTGNQRVYAFSSNQNGASAVVAQADINLSAASQVTVSVGAASGNTNPLTG
jgi:hypothetical protein